MSPPHPAGETIIMEMQFSTGICHWANTLPTAGKNSVVHHLFHSDDLKAEIGGLNKQAGGLLYAFQIGTLYGQGLPDPRSGHMRLWLESSQFQPGFKNQNDEILNDGLMELFQCYACLRSQDISPPSVDIMSHQAEMLTEIEAPVLRSLLLRVLCEFLPDGEEKISILTEVANLCKTKNDTIGEEDALRSLARNLIVGKRYREALDCLIRVVDLQKVNNVEPECKIEVLKVAVSVCRIMGLSALALPYSEELLACLPDNDPHALGSACEITAEILLDQDQKSRAYKLLLKALEYYDAISERIGMVRVYMRLADMFADEDCSPLGYLHHAFSILDTDDPVIRSELENHIDYRKLRAHVLKSIMWAYRMDVKQAHNALPFAMKLLELARDIGDRDSEAESLQAVATIYYEGLNINVSIEFLHKAIVLYRELSRWKDEATCLKLLIDVLGLVTEPSTASYNEIMKHYMRLLEIIKHYIHQEGYDRGDGVEVLHADTLMEMEDILYSYACKGFSEEFLLTLAYGHPYYKIFPHLSWSSQAIRIYNRLGLRKEEANAYIQSAKLDVVAMPDAIPERTVCKLDTAMDILKDVDDINVVRRLRGEINSIRAKSGGAGGNVEELS